MAIKRVKNIPTHNFKREELPVQVRKIDHKNHYDFTQRHRHSYFEIILFIKGEGNQLIDFNAYEVKSNTCYIVCPQQIHLLNRGPGSYGFVLQFKEEAVFSVKLQKLLQERAWSGAEAILFEQNEELMNKVTLYINMLQVVKYAKSLKPSARGELEITDLLKKYKLNKNLSAEIIGRGGAWLDTGSIEDYYKTIAFVQAVENRQGLKIACLEEIAFKNNWIKIKDIKNSIKFYGNCDYSKYLKSLIN